MRKFQTNSGDIKLPRKCGIRVVGKGSWKEPEVGKFKVEKPEVEKFR